MRLVIDMNLSPAWVGIFADLGTEAVHWGTIGPANAPDTEIMVGPRGMIASSSLMISTLQPSFVSPPLTNPASFKFGAEDVRPSTMGKYVRAAILQTKDELQRGALVAMDPRKNRIATLPLQQE